MSLRVDIPDVRAFYAVWAVALVTYGVGDLLTTMAIVDAPGLREANPLVRSVVAVFGSAGFVGLKLAVFAVAVGLSADFARDGDSWYLPPALLATVGGVVVVHNVGLLVP